jgi:pyruvate-ferredoxin/flavodoxin oxidoreductase
MIPNMYKIAGELTPAVFHVAARSIAAQGLSIFGDHQDVMAVRATGWGLLAAHSVQAVMDMALIAQAAALDQFSFLERLDLLKVAQHGATFLLNSPYGPDEVWDHLPQSAQRDILAKQLRLFVIDAYKVAKDTGMGGRINTVMQTCFFALSGALPRDEAIAAIKHAIEKTYQKRGEAVVQKNCAAVDCALAHLHEVAVPDAVTSEFDRRPAVSAAAPQFVRNVLGVIISGAGDALPVSAMPADGTYPTGTSKWEKRNLALEIPVWEEELCIQSGKCVMVCPHAVIRAKLCDAEQLSGAPASFKSSAARWKDREQLRYLLQVAPEDCPDAASAFRSAQPRVRAKPGRRR